ncbi:MAG TPA: glycosyltransferase family 4 protein [Vicinamibacteria bacterium]|jgi:glycosyltransferase involved in cell wall biosynthesis|nr:glycosyltransferase family 4 protein [Vicinamibacteria bacterium]
MKILMVTPHLPPDQAANALLPHLLGRALESRGHHCRFMTFGRGPDRDGVTFIRRRRGGRLRLTRIPQALEAAETWFKGDALVRHSDVVHIHSNTWMNQVAAALASRRKRPYVLTHYGTEIWHHDGRDRRFRGMNRDAHHVTFYSQALLEKGAQLGVPFRKASVVYPPVADVFRPLSPESRDSLRRHYLEGEGTLLLNVKRLHPLADQGTLLEALALVLKERSNCLLLIAGQGPLEAELKAHADRLRLRDRVRFLGLVPNEDVALLQGAADLFVLPSILEATPTVALEALAAETPVLSSDNPGGLELHGLFGDDVRVVRRQDPRALASGILAVAREAGRTRPETAELIEARFRTKGVVDTYLALYEEAVGA